jgi:hypothetical protein
VAEDHHDNCDDYACDKPENHTHVGVQPHLRRVMDGHRRLIDGATGQPISSPKEEKK